MNLLLAALTTPPASGTPAISLTDSLLVLSFFGLLVAAYQLNRVLQRLEAIERRLATASGPRTTTQPPVGRVESNGDLPPEIVAAISAVCYLELGAAARVVSITSGSDAKQVWSLEGRRQIFASHQIR